MTGHAWLDVIISVSAALVLSWLALIVALAIRRPKGSLLKEALRLLPNLLRLLKRLTTDRTLPTGGRVRVALLFIYLAIPIDLIPDFIPVLGYADDASSSYSSCAVCAAACLPKNCERPGPAPMTVLLHCCDL